jgi:hypothetical protein
MNGVPELLLVIALNAFVLGMGFCAVYWLSNDVRRLGR